MVGFVTRKMRKLYQRYLVPGCLLKYPIILYYFIFPGPINLVIILLKVHKNNDK